MIISFKLTKMKLTIALVAIGIIICAIILLIPNDHNNNVSSTLNSSNKIKSAKAETNEQRIDFLKNLGWEVDAQPVETIEVQIPKEFNDVIVNYNEIQKAQGFDLTKYQGKRLMRYTYKITNYPNANEQSGDVLANIFVYSNKVVAGDICSSELNGFMHGLRLDN